MGCNNCGGYYPFPPQQCGGTYGAPSGPQLCRNYPVAVRKNFVVPAADSTTVIETTDTSLLFVGQGIRIGDTYYTITDILDSLRIEVKSNGLGGAAGTLIYAQHPEYGCYQYAIEPIGKVSLDNAVGLVGLDAAGSGAISGAIPVINANSMSYGYVGPTTLDFMAYAEVTLANTPQWFGFAFPVPVRSIPPFPAFSAWIQEGAGQPVVAVGKLGAGSYFNHVIVGKGGGALFSDGDNRIIAVSGRVEILA